MHGETVKFTSSSFTIYSLITTASFAAHLEMIIGTSLPQFLPKTYFYSDTVRTNVCHITISLWSACLWPNTIINPLAPEFPFKFYHTLYL